jgi:hypothetical protein
LASKEKDNKKDLLVNGQKSLLDFWALFEDKVFKLS